MIKKAIRREVGFGSGQKMIRNDSNSAIHSYFTSV